MLERLTTNRLWLVAALAALISSAVQFEQSSHKVPNGHGPGVLLTHALQVAAYALASILSRKILDDYPRGSRMRRAWLLMCAASTAALIRYTFEWLTYALGWIDRYHYTLVSLRQVPVVISLVLLTGGLSAMLWSFQDIGMRVRFRGVDYLFALAILAFVPGIFALRDRLSDAHSQFAIIRFLQSLSPFLLALPTLLGIALHRISQQMGDGQMAFSLRCLVGFLALRLPALFVSLLPDYGTPSVILLGVRAGVFAGATWLFVLAVAYRWQLTQSARRLADEYSSAALPGAGNSWGATLR
ncbi:hypothetical protein [Paludibaculum fermentans]|uniref:hypothetical protein n=1 Tax=Paludibaculum fermentans TaxID=1473598 RepID=UPI003EB6AF64